MSFQVDALLQRAERHLAEGAFQNAHADAMSALQLNPQTPGAFFVLAMIAAAHDNHAKAVEVYDRGLALAPDTGRFHAWKARSLIALNRRDTAIEAARVGGACKGLSAQTLDTIGVVLSRAGLHDEASDYYRRATEDDPDSAEYWYNLAIAEQFLGRFGPAADAFRRTVALKPAHARALSSLIQLEKQTESGSDRAAAEALFDTSKDADDRLQLGHALAKACEDVGDVAGAMDWLKRAKAVKAAQIGYQLEADRAMFEAAAASNPGDGTDGFDGEAPIFVVGLPRTGTTLVDRILTRHPDVESAGELTDFALELKRAAGTSSRYVLDAETLSAAGRVDLKAVGANYAAAARKIVPDAPRIIDKMPLNILCAPAILAALPNARVICLRRHPGDTVLSNYRQLFATDFSYYNYAFDLRATAEYYRLFEGLVDQLAARLPDDRFMQVWYEDIVADLETQARRLVAFCGLEWTPECLSFHENAAPVATASSVQVRQPLYSSSVGRWKRYAPHMQEALDVLGLSADAAADQKP